MKLQKHYLEMGNVRETTFFAWHDYGKRTFDVLCPPVLRLIERKFGHFLDQAILSMRATGKLANISDRYKITASL